MFGRSISGGYSVFCKWLDFNSHSHTNSTEWILFFFIFSFSQLLFNGCVVPETHVRSCFMYVQCSLSSNRRFTHTHTHSFSSSTYRNKDLTFKCIPFYKCWWRRTKTENQIAKNDKQKRQLKRDRLKFSLTRNIRKYIKYTYASGHLMGSKTATTTNNLSKMEQILIYKTFHTKNTSVTTKMETQKDIWFTRGIAAMEKIIKLHDLLITASERPAMNELCYKKKSAQR